MGDIDGGLHPTVDGQSLDDDDDEDDVLISRYGMAFLSIIA